MRPEISDSKKVPIKIDKVWTGWYAIGDRNILGIMGFLVNNNSTNRPTVTVDRYVDRGGFMVT